MGVSRFTVADPDCDAEGKTLEGLPAAPGCPPAPSRGGPLTALGRARCSGVSSVAECYVSVLLPELTSFVAAGWFSPARGSTGAVDGPWRTAPLPPVARCRGTRSAAAAVAVARGPLETPRRSSGAGMEAKAASVFHQAVRIESKGGTIHGRGHGAALSIPSSSPLEPLIRPLIQSVESTGKAGGKVRRPASPDCQIWRETHFPW